MRSYVQAVSEKGISVYSAHRERKAACTPREARVGSDSCGACAAVFTIVEPAKPKGMAGFSLCPEVGRINDIFHTKHYRRG